MTITKMWKVTCPSCKQTVELLFNPDTQNYILLRHRTTRGFKCASSNNVYPKELAKQVFGE